MSVAERTQGPALSESGLEAHSPLARLQTWLEASATSAFILHAVLVVLFLAIFPLIVSLYVSLSRLQFVPGGFQLTFVGLDNYAKLVVGIDREHFMGRFGEPHPIGWLFFGLVVLSQILLMYRYIRGGNAAVGGAIGRIVTASAITAGAWLIVHTLGPASRPGTVVVTLIYVFAGIVIQYTLGLGLAYLCIQQIPARRFFRVVFLIPMMITPVGIAYLFRMLADTTKGPVYPIWNILGLANTSWVSNPWGARAAVMIGDVWQWTPFMFIVLLAALESQSIEPIEAAVVDGASRWQIFWEITIPTILPVSSTLILIRMIEAFKIVDLPNVLTNGGPGTATESLTLHAYTIWRTLDIGGSAAVAYMLLFMVTFIGVSYANLIRQRLAEA
ncbi:MAG: sugar ABC transporter permease [Chloroflexi bacterium]|nr:sugar ABC transporter permease [Chloroflexota bacterium]